MTAGRWARVKSVFDGAFDLTRAARGRYLAALSDSGMRNEVGRLLKDDGSFLECPAWEVATGPVCGEQALVAQVLNPGEEIAGRWRIESFLGAGGMGEVYRALDLEVNEAVALKTLRYEIANNAALAAKLRNELQLARRVAHRNICRLFDFNRSVLAGGNEIVFLTMELLEGPTLSEVLRTKVFTAAEARPIVGQLAEGLEAAHRAGVIHRDLKSGNIMMVACGTGGTRAVITDFGLAHDDSLTGHQTMTGGFAGTPAYMSPEQLQGKPTSALTDVYALGVVLFQMLTGRLPFEGTSPIAISLQRMREDAPSPRVHVPQVPGNWERAIAACLERNPANRPQSAAQVIGAIDTGTGLRVRVSRRWLVAGGAAMVTAGIVPFWTRQAKPLDPEAVRSFKRGEEFSKRRTAENLKNAVEEYEGAIRRESGYAEAWAGLADAYSAMANFNFIAPREGLDKARAAALQATELAPRMAKARGALAYSISLDVHRWLQAEPHFRRAIALDPKQPNVRMWFGGYLGKRGKFDEAIAQVRAGLNEDPSSFALNHQLAAELFRARRFSELLRQAIELVRLQPFEAGAYQMRAIAEEWNGQLEKAMGSLAEAEKYRNSPITQCLKGCVEAARGNVGVARGMAERLTEIWRKAPFESLLLAALWCRIGQKEKAVETLWQGYKREDSTVITAMTSPYLSPLGGLASFAEFRKAVFAG